MIFTETRVRIIDIFKGDFRDSIITVITPGGMVDDFFQFQTHAIELAASHSGYFFLKGGNENNYNFVDIEKGFCQNNEDLNPKISFNGTQYMQYEFEKMIIKETNLPKVSFSYLRKNSFILRETDRDSCDIISATHENTIQLTVDNIEINGIRQYIDFDVMAKVNTPGLKFGKGFLVIKYSKKIGSNLVTSGSLEITKGNIIKNNLYDLEYQDINSSNILIQIDSKLPSDSLYTFSDTIESILHVRLNLNDFINIEDISKKDLNVIGNLFYYCIDEYSLFDSLIVEGGYQPSNSTSPIGIEYTFENPEVTQNNTKFSIDLYAKATASSLYSDAFIYVDYNNLGFGTNVINNGTFTFVQKDLIGNPEVYDVILGDEDENTIAIVVASENDPSLYQTLSTSPRMLGTLNFSIVDCNQNKNINFNPFTVSASHVYFISDNVFPPYGWYNPVIADDPENGKICGCDKPVITSFSPTTIHAGTGEILTINGSNFGNWSPIESFVYFKNGDDGGNTWVKSHPSSDINWDNIIHWNDTEIQIKVPSVGGDAILRKPASSGQIKIENKCGEVVSNNILTIPYSLINIKRASKPKKVAVKELDQKGICFTYDNDLPQWIRTEFENALKDWCPETEIGFYINQLDENLSSAVINDGINIVIGQQVDTEQGGAALLFTGRYEFCTGGMEEGYYLTDIDLIIDPYWTNISDFDLTQDIKTSMKNKLKHELGHAHMINHSVIPGINYPLDQSIVYWSFSAITSNVYDVSIKTDDAVGANEVFTNSQNILSNTGCGLAVTKNSQCGNSCSSVNKNAEVFFDDQVIVFPNPSNGNLMIKNLNIIEIKNCMISIIDELGQVILTKEFPDLNNIVDIPINIQLNSGIYFLKFRNENKNFIKKIIIQ